MRDASSSRSRGKARSGAARVSRGEIYVQIPAYRDSELSNTLLDLYGQAAQPARLRVVVIWQRDKAECLAPAVRRLPNLEIIDVPYTASRGCNWARDITQRRWRGEEYTLLLDSHHRFRRGWDETTIDMYETVRRSGVRKPIITAYLPAYDPEHEPTGRLRHPYRIYPLARERGLLTRLTSYPIPSWKFLTAPVRADFVSLHFLFAAGRYNREIPPDDSIYFFGDEVATSLRAFASGYDFFHPHRIVGWHCYDRAQRVPHWHDHADAGRRTERGFAILRRLFTGKRRGRFALGRQRTVKQYEERIMMPLAREA